MGNRIITISREFGSGGRELGKRLSDQLGVPYFDREILEELSKRLIFRKLQKHILLVLPCISTAVSVSIRRSHRGMQKYWAAKINC